jgi:hypothetical protein
MGIFFNSAILYLWIKQKYMKNTSTFFGLALAVMLTTTIMTSCNNSGSDKGTAAVDSTATKTVDTLKLKEEALAKAYLAVEKVTRFPCAATPTLKDCGGGVKFVIGYGDFRNNLHDGMKQEWIYAKGATIDSDGLTILLAAGDTLNLKDSTSVNYKNEKNNDPCKFAPKVSYWTYKAH